MDSSFRELGMEYEKSIEIQKNVIETYLRQLKQAREKSKYGEIKRLNSLLRVLYDEKLELEKTANELKKYYT